MISRLPETETVVWHTHLQLLQCTGLQPLPDLCHSPTHLQNTVPACTWPLVWTHQPLSETMADTGSAHRLYPCLQNIGISIGS